MTRLQTSIVTKQWFWPAVASLVLLSIIVLLTGELRLGTVTANLTAASFLAMVGIGQMFPIASGEGGIDLSIPSVMGFCAFVAVKMIGTDPFLLIAVIPVAVGFGLIVGAANGLVVTFVRIPPIIGTLATGFIVLTLVQIISANGATTIDNRTLVDMIRGSVLGIPAPFFVVLAVAALAFVLLSRRPYGRHLLAVGQSRRAAHLSGINVNRTIIVAYLLSGALSALTGVLLACSVGSADLELGNPFLLTSVGAVVLGGNRIAGGTASISGTIFGAFLLTLLTLAVTVAGFPIEVKYIATGLVITFVLLAANSRTGDRARKRGV